MKMIGFKNSIKLSAISALLALCTTSCDDSFFENEGDCTVRYYLDFVYDMNLKWADAFPSEVHSVNVYCFDEERHFVKELTAKAPETDEVGFRIPLELDYGKYTLVGWCGLDNNVAEESFSVTNLVPGESTVDDLICSLNVKKDAEGNEYSDDRIYFLYHGNIEAELIDYEDGSEHTFTMPLIKDTNHLRLMIQQASKDITADEVELSMTLKNGVMAWNNTLLGNTSIAYKPWNIETDIIDYNDDTKADGTSEMYQGIVADMSTCRLLTSMAGDVKLTVKKTEGEEVVFNVPLVEYALMLKSYYKKAYGHPMTNQEFLDRKDEYEMTFFLDEGLKWMDVTIDVLSWRIVRHDYSLGE